METSREVKLSVAKKKLRKYQQTNRQGVVCENNNDIVMNSKRSRFPESKRLDGANLRSDTDVVVNMMSINSLQSIEDDKKADSLSVAVLMEEPNDVACTFSWNNEASHIDDTADVTLVNDTFTTAATETLLNLSRQMNGLITEPDKKRDARLEIVELERRNVELAEKLQKHAMMNENLSQQVARLREFNARLQREKGDENKNELALLHKQLTQRQDMISSLTREKMELQVQLQATLQLSEQRRVQLNSATERLAQTEAKLLECEATQQQSQQLSERLELLRVQNSGELRSLREELTRAQMARNELLDKNHDLQANLQAKCAECTFALKQVEELHRQVELAQFHSNQVALGSDVRSKEQIEFIEKLEAERGQLTERINQANGLVASLTEERKRLALSSRALADQQQQQVARLREENAVLGREKTQLVTRLTELQDMENRRLHAIADEADLSRDAQIAEQRLQVVQQALRDAEDRATANCAALTCQLAEATRRAESLEDELTKLNKHRDQLIDQIQVNRVALSESLARNDSLKDELFELQNAFMTLSNRNSALTASLQQEQLNAETYVLGDVGESALPMRRRHSDSVVECYGKEDHKLCAMNADLAQLEYERNVLLMELADSRQKTEEFAKHVALMEQLETRFNSCMRSLADSEEENDALRHKIVQLESETDCIGEYAALYQQQRAMLQQRERTQEAHIARLNKERALLREQLAQVQSLLEHTFKERGQDDVVDVQKLSCTKELSCALEPAFEMENFDVTAKGDALAVPQSISFGKTLHESNAQRILHLLSEIDFTKSSTSDISESLNDSRTHLYMTSGPCKYCTGQLLVV